MRPSLRLAGRGQSMGEDACSCWTLPGDRGIERSFLHTNVEPETMAIATRSISAPDKVSIKRALLSVFDKTGLLDLAEALTSQGTQLLSTGGTSRALQDAGYPVTDVSDVTGFPEIMDGRVKNPAPGGTWGIAGDP